MKYITIPKDVEIIDPQTKKVVQTLNFAEWATKTVLNNHSVVGKTGESLLMSVDLKMEFKDKQPGDVVRINDDEYDLLWRAVNHPPSPYVPVFMEQAVTFLRAVRDATEEGPEK